MACSVRELLLDWDSSLVERASEKLAETLSGSTRPRTSQDRPRWLRRMLTL